MPTTSDSPKTSNEALLHRIPEIDNFLSLERDDKFIVIGTKRFGKALLLKAERILYRRRVGTGRYSLTKQSAAKHQSPDPLSLLA